MTHVHDHHIKTFAHLSYIQIITQTFTKTLCPSLVWLGNTTPQLGLEKAKTFFVCMTHYMTQHIKTNLCPFH